MKGTSYEATVPEQYRNQFSKIVPIDKSVTRQTLRGMISGSTETMPTLEDPKDQSQVCK